MKKLINTKYITALILAAAVVVAAMIIITSPETKKHKPEKAVPAVSTTPLEKGNYAIKVEAFGRVIPAREVAITPEVTGKIVELGREIQPGGILKKGDLIIQIDKADYELQIDRAAASLRQAEAALELEKGRQKVAKREWEIFGKDVDPSLASGELALRKPQLAEADANVKSANAALEEAKLNLERTTILAPFDSIVLEEEAEIGQRVGSEMTVARIVGTDSFWINASVPFDSFQLITPASEDKGAPVTVYLDTGLGGDIPRCGSVIRKLGDLDPEGRMGRVLISIEDPLSLKNGGDRNAIPLESYVKVEISAGELENVYKIPRQGIRENSSVWVAGPDNRLAINDVKIVWRYKDDVYVKDGFTEGDRLITSHLASVIPGMEVVVRDNGGETKQVASTITDSICE
jgi:RND family efflux transporter MFP subunit